MSSIRLRPLVAKPTSTRGPGSASPRLQQQRCRPKQAGARYWTCAAESVKRFHIYLFQITYCILGKFIVQGKKSVGTSGCAKPHALSVVWAPMDSTVEAAEIERNTSPKIRSISVRLQNPVPHIASSLCSMPSQSCLQAAFASFSSSLKGSFRSQRDAS